MEFLRSTTANVINILDAENYGLENGWYAALHDPSDLRNGENFLVAKYLMTGPSNRNQNQRYPGDVVYPTCGFTYKGFFDSHDVPSGFAVNRRVWKLAAISLLPLIEFEGSANQDYVIINPVSELILCRTNLGNINK
jgi:hypothetical protein